MADDVGLRQGLLDEQQVIGVKAGKMCTVGPSIGRVGIDLQRCVGADELTNRSDVFDVGSGLDLELDADVAVVHVALDSC